MHVGNQLEKLNMKKTNFLKSMSPYFLWKFFFFPFYIEKANTKYKELGTKMLFADWLPGVMSTLFQTQIPE